jgi:hypothetical protein
MLSIIALALAHSVANQPILPNSEVGSSGISPSAPELVREVVFDDLTVFSLEEESEAAEFLANNANDSELLLAMEALIGDEDAFSFVRLATSPVAGDAMSREFFDESPARLLEIWHGGLLSMANPGRGDIAAVELWLGCSTDVEAHSYASVTMLVGTRLDGSKSLILGMLGEASGDSYLDTPRMFIGDWLYGACEEVGEGQDVEEFSFGPEPPVKKGRLKKAVTNFARCFRQCFSSLYPALTPLQLFCIGAVAVGCIPAGPGWGACFLAGSGVCGLGFLGVSALACGVFCL